MGLLDTLAMVSLGIRQTEQTLLQEVAKIEGEPSLLQTWTGPHILFAIPKSKSDVLQAVGIGHTGDTVLTPAVSSGPRMVVGKVYSGSERSVMSGIISM